MSITEEITKLLTQCIPDRSAQFQWSDDLALVNDLGMASIELIRLYSLVEARFDIDMFDDGEAVARVKTLGDVAALVGKLQVEGSDAER